MHTLKKKKKITYFASVVTYDGRKGMICGRSLLDSNVMGKLCLHSMLLAIINIHVLLHSPLALTCPRANLQNSKLS